MIFFIIIFENPFSLYHVKAFPIFGALQQIPRPSSSFPFRMSILRLLTVNNVRWSCIIPWLALRIGAAAHRRQASSTLPPDTYLFPSAGASTKVLENVLLSKFAKCVPSPMYGFKHTTKKIAEISLFPPALKLEEKERVWSVGKDLIASSSIIDSPHEALNYPLLSKDVLVDVLCLEQTALGTVNSRMKPVYFVLRGQGGGKTRILEECRLHMQVLYADWLAIPITFNTYWNLEAREYADFERLCGNVSKPTMQQICLAASVSTRILCMFYNISLLRARKEVELIVKEMASYTDSSELAEKLLIGTIQHVAGRVARDMGKNIDKFTLLVDEAKVFIDVANAEDDDDVYDIIRSTLLNNEMQYEDAAGTIRKFKCSLVLSTLAEGVVGYTSSHRPIKPIVLPGLLAPQEAVNRIWGPIFEKKNITLSSKETRALELLAALCGRLPRVLEQATEAIHRLQDTTVKSDMMAAIVTSTLEGINNRYLRSDAELLIDTHQHAMIFQKPILINEAKSSIEFSIFTNSLFALNTMSDKSSRMVPEVCLILLYETVLKYCLDNGALNMIGLLFKQVLDRITDFHKGKVEDGQLLEDIALGWLRIRAKAEVSLKHSFGSLSPGLTTLGRLLNIEIEGLYRSVGQISFPIHGLASDNIVVGYTAWLKKALNTPFPSACTGVTAVANSNDINAFAKFLVSNNSVLHIYNSPKGDSYDIGVLATVNDIPFVIFIDCKSKSMHTNSTNYFKEFGSDTAFRQFRDMNEVALNCSSSKLAGGYLDALKQGNWMFIYMTTVDTPDLLVEGKHMAANMSTHASTGNVLVMGKNSTMGFLSIFGDAYEAGRGFADSR